MSACFLCTVYKHGFPATMVCTHLHVRQGGICWEELLDLGPVVLGVVAQQLEHVTATARHPASGKGSTTTFSRGSSILTRA